jgi:predicted deacylase
MAGIATSLDFTRDGKQTDFLRLSFPCNRSSFYAIPIPIVQVRNAEGPTVLLLAGTHGDEFEGQVTLTRLAQSIEPADVTGRLLILPMANFPAARAGIRKSAFDDRDLNRSYPGDSAGEPTQQIAHYIETTLLPLCDVVLDLHSGGYSSAYGVLTVVLGGTSPDVFERNMELARVFGAPQVLLLEGGKSPEKGTGVMAAALRQGAACVTAECGGAARLSSNTLDACESGVMRVLRHLGLMKRADGVAPASPPRVCVSHGPDCFIYARENGLFEPAAPLGAAVNAGELAGTIHFPDTPWRPGERHYFARGGSVINVRVPALTERGDMLYRLAHDPA